jgi:hypothetical protein
MIPAAGVLGLLLVYSQSERHDRKQHNLCISPCDVLYEHSHFPNRFLLFRSSLRQNFKTSFILLQKKWDLTPKQPQPHPFTAKSPYTYAHAA